MKQISFVGWCAVGLSTIITCLWAFWGAFEAFHEGWYFESLTENLVYTARYFTLMMIFLVLSMLPLHWPRVGSILYVAFSMGFLIWILATRESLSFGVVVGWLPVTVPPFFAGILFWTGRPRPLKRAYLISALLPLLVAVAFAAEPLQRIAGRVDDGNRGMRVIEGNGVTLVWAPLGPGWPNPDPHSTAWLSEWRGPTWEEATRICRYLTADGKSVAETPQNIWRLPTAEEIVRSMVRHGNNCGGLWDANAARASYKRKPDKESPLWHPHSPIIYWWTASERNAGRSYYVDFTGNVYPRDKKSNIGSQAFRAVKNLRPE